MQRQGQLTGKPDYSSERKRVMAISNRDRVRRGLDELRPGLAPFVARELKAKLGSEGL